MQTGCEMVDSSEIHTAFIHVADVLTTVWCLTDVLFYLFVVNDTWEHEQKIRFVRVEKCN